MRVIGQENIKERIKKEISHFIILVGKRGQGKTTISKYIAEQLNANYYKHDSPKVEDIRTIIEKSYRLTNTEIYYIAGELSNRVMNALLKIIEEPSEKAYFIMGVTSPELLLFTIISRAQVVRLEPYTKEQLRGFIKEGDKNILKYADNPGQVNILKSVDFNNLLTVCKKIVNNISKISAANVFNIITHLEPYKDMMDIVINILFELYLDKIKQGETCNREITVLIKYNNLINNKYFSQDKVLENLFIDLRGGVYINEFYRV